MDWNFFTFSACHPKFKRLFVLEISLETMAVERGRTKVLSRHQNGGSGGAGRDKNDRWQSFAGRNRWRTIVFRLFYNFSKRRERRVVGQQGWKPTLRRERQKPETGTCVRIVTNRLPRHDTMLSSSLLLFSTVTPCAAQYLCTTILQIIAETVTAKV